MITEKVTDRDAQDLDGDPIDELCTAFSPVVITMLRFDLCSDTSGEVITKVFNFLSKLERIRA